MSKKQNYLSSFIGFLFICIISVPVWAGDLGLEHPLDSEGHNISGDGSTVITREDLELSALVVSHDGTNCAGVEINFVQVAPRERALGKAISDSNGLAKLIYSTGKKNKPVTIVANIARALVQRYGEKIDTKDVEEKS